MKEGKPIYACVCKRICLSVNYINAMVLPLPPPPKKKKIWIGLDECSIDGVVQVSEGVSERRRKSKLSHLMGETYTSLWSLSTRQSHDPLWSLNSGNGSPGQAKSILHTDTASP